MTPQLSKEVNNLRTLLNDISRLESRRSRKIESFKLKAQADDVNPELHKEAARLEREHPMQKIDAAQFEDFFDQRLMRYDTDRTILDSEQQDQAALLSRLTDANTSFTSARRGDTSTKSREHALQQLENAYFAYREIVQNLDVGRKFYNDLASIVSAFRDSCRTFASQRRGEAEQMEADILTALPLASLSLGSQQEQQLPVQKQQRPGDGDLVPREDRKGAAKRQIEMPLPAPVAVKPGVATVANNGRTDAGPSTWTPELGIKFAGQTTSSTGQDGRVTDTAKGNGRGTWDPSRGMKFA